VVARLLTTGNFLPTAADALQVLLWLLALDAALGSLLLLFGGRSLFVTLFPYPPASEVTDLLLLKQKGWGGLGVALTLMLVAAARNPLTSLIVVRAVANWSRRRGDSRRSVHLALGCGSALSCRSGRRARNGSDRHRSPPWVPDVAH
jgi:hypothetical protein